MENKEQYDFCVFILRAQPLHRGHEAILRRAFEIAKTPIFIIGSSTSPRSIRNPFTLEERITMITSAVEEFHLDDRSYHLIWVSDSAYNFHDWLIRIKSEVKKIIKEENPFSTIFNNSSIALLGHYRDDTSYYLNYFPEYTFIPIEPLEADISSTEIREQFLSKGEGTDLLFKYCSSKVQSLILTWLNSLEARRVIEEFSFIKEYKRQWQSAPYPPTFVTTDAIVMSLGHVLLIKRGRHPGKGLYALPGGFLNQNETIQDGAIRELKEETLIDISKRALELSIKNQHVFDHPYRDPRGRMITHAFLFDLDVPVLPKIEAADDASEVKWIPLQNLEAIEDRFYGDHSQIIKYFLNRMR